MIKMRLGSITRSMIAKGTSLKSNDIALEIMYSIFKDKIREKKNSV
jgi:hypothetical protein